MALATHTSTTTILADDHPAPPRSRRRAWIGTGAAGLVVGAVTLAAVAASFWPASATLPAPATPAVKPVLAQAQAVPAMQAKLAFKTAGTVSRIVAKPGDAVQAGDILVELDAAELALRVEEARVNLEAQRLQLAQAMAPSLAEIRLAQENVRQAEARLAGAQARLRKTQESAGAANGEAAPGRIDLTPLGGSGTLDLSFIGGAGAPAPSPEDVLAAQSEVDMAASNLRAAQIRLEETRQPRTEQVQTLEARVKQAELALAQAELAQANAVLRAPIDGAVAAVSVRTGELVGTGAPAVVIASLHDLQFETKDLDEISAAGVQPGQDVAIVVPALDKRVLKGTVASVAPQPVVSTNGDVSYSAVITLAEPAPGLRWGMSARVEFPPAGHAAPDPASR